MRMTRGLFFTLLAVSASASMQWSYTYQKELRAFDEATNLARAYEYLNQVRQAVGLDPYAKNSLLEKAAAGHTLYLSSNNATGHYQAADKKNFTGVDPSSREIAAGYDYRSAGENLAAGPRYAMDAVNSLMEAIFHRFGFVSPLNDEVGISFRYDHPAYGAVSVFNMGSRSYIDKEKSFVSVFPIDGQQKVKIDFYSDEESPDPIPEKNRVGYPISITFANQAATSIGSFELFDSNNTKVAARSITGEHVPKNNYCIIPEAALEYATTYKAVFSGTLNGSAIKKEWRFTTLPLENFRSDPANPTMRTNETKHLYLYGGSGQYTGIRWSYSLPDPISSIALRGNEIEIVSNGAGGTVTLEAKDSDDRILTVSLNISANNAQTADAAPVFTGISSQPTALSANLTLFGGWNLAGSPVNGSFSAQELINSGKVSALYGFDAASQSYYTPQTVEANKGYWIKATSAFEFSTSAVTPLEGNLTLLGILNSAVKDKWNMLSAPFKSSRSALFELNATAVWPFDTTVGNYTTSETIEAGRGFWLKR